jgi:hypothetical protein
VWFHLLDIQFDRAKVLAGSIDVGHQQNVERMAVRAQFEFVDVNMLESFNLIQLRCLGVNRVFRDHLSINKPLGTMLTFVDDSLFKDHMPNSRFWLLNRHWFKKGPQQDDILA